MYIYIHTRWIRVPSQTVFGSIGINNDIYIYIHIILSYMNTPQDDAPVISWFINPIEYHPWSFSATLHVNSNGGPIADRPGRSFRAEYWNLGRCPGDPVLKLGKPTVEGKYWGKMMEPGGFGQETYGEIMGWHLFLGKSMSKNGGIAT
jgi:hypothetical protein